MAIPEESTVDGQSLAADAFKRLYPEQYFSRFVDDGIRPDGRVLGAGRETTVVAGVISVADGSALVKVGSTTVMAGVRYEVQRPAEEAPDRGMFNFNVEIAPFSSAHWRPGKAPELISYVTERLRGIIGGPGSPLDLKQLCIAEGKACWAADMNIYILNSDGGVLDASLLAMIAALASSMLPATRASEDGDKFFKMAGGETAGKAGEIAESRPLSLSCMPLATTCGMYGDHLLTDPTAEEENICTSAVTVVLDETNKLHGMYKAGGNALASAKLMTRCIETTKLRYKQQREMLLAALEPSEEMQS
eukprot:gene24102-9677_t